MLNWPYFAVGRGSFEVVGFHSTYLRSEDRRRTTHTRDCAFSTGSGGEYSLSNSSRSEQSLTVTRVAMDNVVGP